MGLIDEIRGIRAVVKELPASIESLSQAVQDSNMMSSLSNLGDANVNTKRPLSYIVTDKDAEFTTALAQYEVEGEDLTGLPSNKIRIKSIAVESDQDLAYRLYIYRNDDGVKTGLDLNGLVEWFDIEATDWKQIKNTAQYVYATTGLDIPYEDADLSKELHLILENLDASGKNAGATGEIVFRIGYVREA